VTDIKYSVYVINHGQEQNSLSSGQFYRQTTCYYQIDMFLEDRSSATFYTNTQHTIIPSFPIYTSKNIENRHLQSTYNHSLFFHLSILPQILKTGICDKHTLIPCFAIYS